MNYSCILLSALHFPLMLSMGTASGVGQDVAAVEIGAGTVLLMESRLETTGGQRTLTTSELSRTHCRALSSREVLVGERP